MKLLLDTNAFLRWSVQRPIPRVAERLITRQDTELLISIVTGWEIVMKNQLSLSVAYVEATIEEMRATLLPIRFAHLEELSNLPFREDHKDPFDRMLIAQALAEDIPIISADTRFTGYKRLRVVWD